MRRQNTLGYGNIIRERYRWILDYADLIAVFFEDFIDVFPTRAIHEAAVNEDYDLHS
jgi:hypothetical protein